MRITEKAIHAALDPVVSQMELSPWAKERMVRTAMSAPAGRVRRRVRFWRPLAAVAVSLALCFASSLAVLASPDLSAKLGQLSQRTRQFLTPTRAETMDAGINLEVLASMQDEDSVIAYLSLTDVSGENRLDAATELPDIRIDGMPTVITGHPVQQEDGSLIIKVQGLRDPTQVQRGRVTLSVGTILSGQERSEFQETGYTAADFLRMNPHPEMAGSTPLLGASIQVESGSLSELVDQPSVQILKPVIAFDDPRIPFWTVQNGGLVDRTLRLHVRRDPIKWYNECSLAFYDPEGQPIAEDRAILEVGRPMDTGIPGTVRTEQAEYVLSLPEQTNLQELVLRFQTLTYATCLQGDWEVTFPVPDTLPLTLTVPCSRSMGTWRLTRIEVSPFGIVASGSGILRETSLSPKIELHLSDGSVLRDFAPGITSVEMGMLDQADQISYKFYFDEPLLLSEVTSVTLNGELLWERGDTRDP